MARTRETSIVESELSEGESAGNVIGRGFSVLVQHNAQLMQSAQEKDRILMQFVAQAQTERSQFWDAQATMIGKFSELLDNIQRLKDKEADRQEQRESAKASREFKSKMLDDARQIVQVGVNQFAKRPMLKEEDKSLLSGLVETIDEQQLEALSKVFRPAQMIVFGKIVDELAKREVAGKTEEQSAEEDPNAVH
jgi:hypothetical protein